MPVQPPPSPAYLDHDDNLMREALAEAEQSIGLSEPNPRVGCLLLGRDGQVIGRGHTQEAGGPHAEVMALRDAAARGLDPRGCSAIVTLEPCAHHGRTPPCCDALVEAGVDRVVMAMSDPNPLVSGRGAQRLRAAGIAVSESTDASVVDRAHELNIGFFSRMRRGRPWVRLKLAASLDGRTALANGESRWITSDAARADGHAWRKRAGAVLTGIGTVIEDNPRLDVRELPTRVQPLRVVVDSRLRTPATARLLDAPGQVLIFTAAPAAAQQATLQARGAEIVALPDGRGRVDLAAVVAELGRRGINELHLETGAVLAGAFVQAGLVDEFLVYLAPRLLGPGRDMTAIGPLTQLADGVSLRFTGVASIGADLRILARPC